jgi:hypothetical protein
VVSSEVKCILQGEDHQLLEQVARDGNVDMNRVSPGDSVHESSRYVVQPSVSRNEV